MARLIDLDKINPMNFPSTEMDGLDVVRYLNTLPAVDAAPVVHGKNLAEDTPSRFECSVCGWVDWDTYTGDTDVYNYCPGCGAKMDGGSQ